MLWKSKLQIIYLKHFFKKDFKIYFNIIELKIMQNYILAGSYILAHLSKKGLLEEIKFFFLSK